MAIQWQEVVTTTPIDNRTEGGEVIMIYSIEGGTPMEIRTAPFYSEGNWAVPYIQIYAGNGSVPTRFIETAITGSASYTPVQSGRARTGGFSRKVTVLSGERSLHVVNQVDGSALTNVWRRYPIMNVVLLQTYR